MDAIMELTLSFIKENLTKDEIKELLKDFPEEEVKKILNDLKKID